MPLNRPVETAISGIVSILNYECDRRRIQVRTQEGEPFEFV